jgi:hypothetical protein
MSLASFVEQHRRNRARDVVLTSYELRDQLGQDDFDNLLSDLDECALFIWAFQSAFGDLPKTVSSEESCRTP